MNNQTRNNSYSNRNTPSQHGYTPDSVRDEYIRQTERTKANNEAAWGTLIGIGIATLLALGIGSLVWPSLFKPNGPQAPTVGPEQTESNTPKTEPRTQEPQRDTVIIERNRTQVVPVPVETPQPPSPAPTPNVNVTVPPAPQPAPNVDVTVPPTAPNTAPNTDGTLLDTNPRPTSDPSVQPPRASSTEGSGETETTTPTEQPQSRLDSTTPDELVSTTQTQTGNSPALFQGRRD
ncbi:hypothetical protein PCC9214_00636 [Planktothrix tepida]|uniref:Uncharacterized protein n=1 Tax=Planktothrix tepida PCC 9214 TaxID=671072 RepID=A0A1J1LFH4_9CYAN|nr:hypothetical protein [Planktothrix tepida]CAD5920638.1 hypothetical protein PCC9214_00636 [Planktothrix tepida]CUR30926.1 hypothetical protein PL9214290517 [Planktothrix tepida PCC 9214]